MAVRLIDAKVHASDDVVAGVISTFAETTPLAGALEFETVPSGVYMFKREADIGTATFRNINAGFSEQTGKDERVVEQCFPMGRDADVDRFIVRTQGEEMRAREEAKAVKAMAHLFDFTFVNGDTDPGDNEFAGMQLRLGTAGSGQHLQNSGSAAALDLIKLDEAIDLVDNPTHLYMTKGMRRRLSAFANTQSGSSNIRVDRDDFGRQFLEYNGLPILEADPNGHSMAPLAFDEASSTTSIYVLNLDSDADGVMAIQTGEPSIRDLGELQVDKVVMRSRIDWDIGLVMQSPRAAARLSNITDAAITV